MRIIQFKDIWEMYRIKFVVDNKAAWENFWALKGINFSVEKGESLGIIGENGAGKTTILKLIMGMIKPDRGELIVNGRAAGILELGAGFEIELTGKENIFLISGLFGLPHEQIEAIYGTIADFASLGKFINAPVKYYSQGMFLRLSFSIAIHVNPDILLIDDTLSVGDEYFQSKCVKKIFELKEQGVTIIFVTHDMNILNRLCKRAIFLKGGAVVKDDLVNKIIPLYSQMIGARQSVGILDNGLTKVVFNNGRILINWCDNLITPQPGVYVSFLILGKWYNSLQADWQVDKNNETALIAKAKMYLLALNLVMRLEINDNHEISLDVEVESQEPVDIQEACLNAVVSLQYTQWASPWHAGEFPPIDNINKGWLPLLEDNSSMMCVGVKQGNAHQPEFPSFIFELKQFSSDIYAQVFNADYFVNARVLQFRRIKGVQNYFSSNIGALLCFSARMLVNPADFYGHIKSIENNRVISNDNLRLIFDKGRIILCYKGMEISKATHISSSIFSEGRQYVSQLACWKVLKDGENKFIAHGKWADLPLIQVWEIEIKNDYSFSWEVSLQVEGSLEIGQQRFQFACSNDYDSWFYKDDTGKYPKDFQESTMDMAQRCISGGEIGLKSLDTRLPAVYLQYNRQSGNFGKILNSDFYDKARILRVERVESEQLSRFSPGNYPSFKIDIVLNEESNLLLEERINSINHNGLKFAFNNGQGHISYNGIDITKKLGFYTSMRSLGRWHDSSSSAAWNIKECQNNIIKAVGKWSYLPITQLWEIELKEEGFIDLKINMLVDNEIEVDRLQANLMLSEKYVNWHSDKDKGAFSLFKDNIDDDWECIYSGKGACEYIGVSAEPAGKNMLPQVKFSFLKARSGWFLKIVNSDIYHRGRLLQYLNPEQNKITPGEYAYFAGRITVQC